ncbi:MAG: hypothetical protein SFV51_27320 [Bryobacteraceae bacterium]|nr:hypothetical protein [Bryobacteraceae bacterium]
MNLGDTVERRFRRTVMILAILGALSALTLHGPIRTATLIFLAGITLKTWIALLRHRQQQAEAGGEPNPTPRVED